MADTTNNGVRNEIIDYFQLHQNEVQNFREQIIKKDVIVFLGNTRSGKSTLVNYLIGTKLEAFEIRKKEFKIRKLNFYDIGPEIGQGSSSCSALPTIYKVEANDYEYIIDLPGFEDNRGIVQEIANAFCISQIQYAKTVKFVVVFDIIEIVKDNVHDFTKTLEYIQDLVSNVDKFRTSFCFIFAKDFREYTQEEIIKLLNNKVLNVKGLEMNKVLIRNVVANEQFIGLFRMPRKSGIVVSNNIAVNVKNAIKSIQSIDTKNCQIKFTISDAANGILLQIYPEYTESNYFDSEIARLTQELDSYFVVDRYVYASHDDELDTTLEILNNTHIYIVAEIEKDLKTLKNVENSLNTLMLNTIGSAVTNDFITKFNFVILMDECKLMEDRYRMMIITNYKECLKNNRCKISMLMQKIKDEKSDRSSTNFAFKASAGGGVLGSVPLLVGVSRVVERLATTGSIVQRVAAPGAAVFTAAEAAVGTAIATGVSLVGGVVVGATAGGLFVSYELYSKRIAARKLQGRD